MHQVSTHTHTYHSLLLLNASFIQHVGDTSDVQIPSVFVAQHQYQALLQLSRSFREPMLVRLVKDDMLTW